MPIVRISLFPGRNSVVKEFVARAVGDAVCEIAGTSREGVHVLFDEVARDDWAIGPRLSSAPEQPETPAWDRAYVSIGRVKVLPGKRDEYLKWRRDSVYPFMASHEGFINSTVLDDPKSPDVYLVINKWVSRAADEAYGAHPFEAELRRQARDYLDTLFTDDSAGDVVDVFHRRDG
jgi:4-oxalocrotonate tautomerase